MLMGSHVTLMANREKNGGGYWHKGPQTLVAHYVAGSAEAVVQNFNPARSIITWCRWRRPLVVLLVVVRGATW